MKQLIKSATVYRATVPTDVSVLEQHFQKHTFSELGKLETKGAGFVPPHPDSTKLALSFHGGVAFAVRIDNKIIPASAVNAEVKKAVERIKKTQGRNPGKAEKKEIKDNVMVDMAAVAFLKTAIITAYYEFATGYLFVPTTSKQLADIVTSQLVAAVGSVKTETINVSDVKHGLTTRMTMWVAENEEAFGRFSPCAAVALKEGERKITVQMSDFEAARQGLKEALSSGFGVMSIGLIHDRETEFRLNADFRLSRIEFATHAEKEDGDGLQLFENEATIEIAALSAVMDTLCEMFAYENQSDNPESKQEDDE